MQVDQRVLDADAVERLAGAWRGVRGQPQLERLDVFAPQVGAAGDVGVGVGQPGAESAQVQVDVSDGVRPQTQRDLFEVALRGLGESRCGGCPSGDRDWRFRRRRAQRGDPAGVEERQPQAVKDRGHVLARGGFAAAGVGGGHRDAGGVEMFVGDRARWRAGDRGDLRQDVPLRRGVPAGNADPGTCFGEPLVVGGAEPAGRDSRPQIAAAEQFGIDGDAAGDHQPGGERPRLGDRVELLLCGQPAPAAGTADLGLATVRRPGRRPARLAPRGPHRGQVVLDDRCVVCGQRQRCGRHGACIACASIASTARRYSPASQSLAKCR